MSDIQVASNVEYLLKSYPQAPEWWKQSLPNIDSQFIHQMIQDENSNDSKKCCIFGNIIDYIESYKLIASDENLSIEGRCIIQHTSMYNVDLYHEEHTEKLSRNQYRKQQLYDEPQTLIDIYYNHTGITPDEVRGNSNIIYSKIIKSGANFYFKLIVPTEDDMNLDIIIRRINENKLALPDEYYKDIPQGNFLTHKRSPKQNRIIIDHNSRNFTKFGQFIPCCDNCGDIKDLLRSRNNIGVFCGNCIGKIILKN